MSHTIATTKTRIENLISLTENLSAIFQEENTLLSSQRARDIEPLQAEKAKLATAYASAIRDIATNRTMIEGTEDQLLESLREMTMRFDTLAQEQRNLLAGINKASTAIVRAIADEASHQAHPQERAGAGYNGHGNSHEHQASAAISINENA